MAFLYLSGYFVVMQATVYDRRFFEDLSTGSYRSAQIVVPILIELFKPLSVVDVGCGTGTWLRCFRENGVTNIKGIDGSYVSAADLVIPPKAFIRADLSHPLGFSQTSDLALCLEVAEHLQKAASTVIVKTLCAISDVVVFSAAVPNQPGTHHVNCQWQSYWADLFASENYGAFDLLRPRLRGNESVAWWYQQNMIVFINLDSEKAKQFPRSASASLDLVHPSLYFMNSYYSLGMRSTARLFLEKLYRYACNKISIRRPG